MAVGFQLGVQLIVQIVDGHQSLQQPGVVVDLLDLRLVILVSGVVDRSHDLLHQILNGHDAGEAAVLVDQDRDILMRFLKLLEELVDIFTFQYKIWLAQQRTDVHMLKAAAPRLHDEVLNIQDADDIVDIFLIYRNSGMTGSQHLVQIGGERFVHIDGVDVRAGGHDLLGQNIVKFKYGIQHLRFILVEYPGFHAVFNQRANLGFRYLFFRHLVMHAHQAEHQSRRKGKQLHDGGCDFGKNPNRANHKHTEGFGFLLSDTLGYQLAQYQSKVGQKQCDDYYRYRIAVRDM